MGTYNWLRELIKGQSEEYLENLLPDMLYEIHSECGIDVLISLLEHLPKIRIYVSPRNIEDGVLVTEITKLTRRQAAKVLSAGMFYIYSQCGAKTLQALLEHFPGITIYVGPGMLSNARTEYVRQHFDGSNAKQVAITMGVSEQYVYETMQKQTRRTKKEFLNTTPRLPF